MPILVALERSPLASTGRATLVPAVKPGPVDAYPPSALKPVRSEGTLPFLFLVAGVGVLVLVGWLFQRRRAASRPGLPDEPLFPPATPHQQIHDRKYLSRIIRGDDPPRS